MTVIKAYSELKKREVTLGKVIDDTFYRTVRSNKEYSTSFKGYGIQSEAFMRIGYAGAEYISINEKHTGKTYWSRYSDWEYPGFERNIGDGLQRFLPVAHMKETKDELLAVPSATTVSKPASQQTSLGF